MKFDFLQSERLFINVRPSKQLLTFQAVYISAKSYIIKFHDSTIRKTWKKWDLIGMVARRMYPWAKKHGMEAQLR